MGTKVYVGVLVEYTPEGTVKPVQVTWEDGRRFSVDRVLDCRRAASLKAGGQGTRYTCRIHGRTAYLFNEEGRWFMERKDGRGTELCAEAPVDYGPGYGLDPD